MLFSKTRIYKCVEAQDFNFTLSTASITKKNLEHKKKVIFCTVTFLLLLENENIRSNSAVVLFVIRFHSHHKFCVS
jgi:hypothetical protein